MGPVDPKLERKVAPKPNSNLRVSEMVRMRSSAVYEPDYSESRGQHHVALPLHLDQSVRALPLSAMTGAPLSTTFEKSASAPLGRTRVWRALGRMANPTDRKPLGKWHWAKSDSLLNWILKLDRSVT